MKKIDKECWGNKTKAVHSGHVRSSNNETSEALYLTSGFIYENAEEAESKFLGESQGYIYSRFGNPTVNMFETRIAALEGCEKAIATASGMSAVNASLLSQLSTGDHVISSKALFGSCRYIIQEILPRFGIEITFVDGKNIDEWKSAITSKTRCAFLESPSNPMLEIIDIPAVSDLIRNAGGKLIVDNAFSTPILQRPLELGADIVVYSATKHIDGQGRCLGGVILSSETFIEETVRPFLRHTGPSLSPFNAWILGKGLETLNIRIREHCSNAMIIAKVLKNQHKIKYLIFPGISSHPQFKLAKKQMSDCGGIVTFEIIGGKEGAFRFLNSLKLVKISNNLGDSKSLITHPATTTHQRLNDKERVEMGIKPGTVRLSIGLEDVKDIEEDLLQALDCV